MAPLIWLVTGTTSGIGRALTQEIVARGDKVIASGRNIEDRLGSLKSDNLALLELDISAGRQAITAKINEAWTIFGHIDVLINNAGISAMKSAEEAEYVSTQPPPPFRSPLLPLFPNNNNNNHHHHQHHTC